MVMRTGIMGNRYLLQSKERRMKTLATIASRSRKAKLLALNDMAMKTGITETKTSRHVLNDMVMKIGTIENRLPLHALISMALTTQQKLNQSSNR